MFKNQSKSSQSESSNAKKTKCFSVRLQSFYPISDKAYKAVSFDGSSDIIPASQYFGPDFEVVKSDAYWIAAWILPSKKIQWSNKKVAWFDKDKNKLPSFHIEKHIPRKEPVKANNEIDELKK